MEFSILIKKQVIKGIKTGMMTVSAVFSLSVYGQSTNHTNPEQKLNTQHYISAFFPRQMTKDSIPSFFLQEKEMAYVIQLCTFDHLLQDSLLSEGKIIQVVRMGDLYRYILPGFTTIEQARKKLAHVQILFPQACIREYRQGKPGQVIDMKIN